MSSLHHITPSSRHKMMSNAPQSLLDRSFIVSGYLSGKVLRSFHHVIFFYYALSLSRIQFLTSKISHICQEICDIKNQRKPQTNISIRNFTSTGLVEEQTNRNYTRAPDNNNFAKEGSSDEDDLGGTYSFHSKLCHHAPNSPDIPSHHAPSLPSPNPPPSGSILEPPGDLSPSPTSRIVTLSPSSLL